jgi:hypothetical protein
LQFTVLDDRDEAEVVGKDIDVVVRRDDERRLELARQVASP